MGKQPESDMLLFAVQKNRSGCSLQERWKGERAKEEARDEAVAVVQVRDKRGPNWAVVKQN